jgi:predicted DCC family thiol-disulfide oxidoreductase YuxK
MAAIYYDDECRFCRDMLRRFGRTLARRRFTFVPLQRPGAARLLGVTDERLLDEMRVRLDDGVVFGGASAVLAIARRNLVGVAALGTEPRARRDGGAPRRVSLVGAQSTLPERLVCGST